MTTGVEVPSGAVDALVASGWMPLDTAAWLGFDLLRGLAARARERYSAGAFFQAGIGRGQQHQQVEAIRRDQIGWLDGEHPAEVGLFAALEALRVHLNRELMLGLRRFEAQYACYQPGDFYKRHLDSFRGAASRVVSVVLYLNENWDAGNGGELVIYGEDEGCQEVARVVPAMGRGVIFLSERIPHEVLPAQATRFSIAVWFRQDD